MPTIPQLAVALRARVGPSRFWRDVEMTDAVLEGVRMWQALTGQITRTTLLLVSGKWADMPRQFARPIRMKAAGSEIPKASTWELDQGFSGWEGGTAGTPQYWAPHGMNEIAMHPGYATPGDMLMEGMADLPYDTVGGENLQMSEGDSQAILEYAQHYLSFKEGPGEVESTQGGLDGLIERAGQANARLRKTNFYRQAMARDRDESERGSKVGESAPDFVRGGMR
jgi:hypothetical protein